MDPPAPLFAHEKLDVYAAALDHVAQTHRLVRPLPRGNAGLADPWTRAATSIAFNTAEGAAEFSRAEKARFFRMALRSAGGSSAITDVALRLEPVAVSQHEESKELLRRVVAMLTVMVEQWEKKGPST